MPFASINPKTQGTIPEIFENIFWELDGFENLSFFESASFKYFQFFFPSFPWKSVKVSWAARMGWNFDDYHGYPRSQLK